MVAKVIKALEADQKAIKVIDDFFVALCVFFVALCGIVYLIITQSYTEKTQRFAKAF